MYRKINVDESQRDLQRIVWKNSKSEEVKTYRLCTVTYGTTSAPYLAMRCLKQLSVDGEQQYPKASTIVKSDFYMDDVLTGAADLETAKDLKGEIIELLGSCGMHLHKWCGNHPELIDTSSDADCYDFNKLSDTKTLGLLWKSQNDVFAFNLSCEDQPKVTKRTVLSKIARIFDPLGLLGPIVTKAKIILQRLWKLKVDWDESLPKKETEEWLRFIHALKKTSNVYVDRYVLTETPVVKTIVGFSDASESAYGACVYMFSSNARNSSCSKLLCSKSRVAPIKTVTVPRLELCAAVLLAKLVTKVLRVLNLKDNFIYFYSDSTIVLAWLQRSPCELKTFVASRVATIQRLTDINRWFHVKSEENAADLVSRGLDPEQLINNDFWFNGPPFLKQDTLNFPFDHENVELGDESYLKEIKCLTVENQPTVELKMTVIFLL
ncbi:uncharacterized protein LOC129223174 [Uloborus diversus]|uniref:uncharacterized protein LOC129223174 n=1 Tax=Uloborus diversus TaxID=327109 RepID=UPI00240A8104|nr:uncharacterized protein LOC129223174 [Uloborus diversus]